MPFLPAPGTRTCNSLDAVSPVLFPPPCFATLGEHSPCEIQDQAPPRLPSRVGIVLASKASLPRNVRPSAPSPQPPNPSSDASWEGGIGVHLLLHLRWGPHPGHRPPGAVFYRYQTVSSRISLSLSSPKTLQRNSLPFCSCHGSKGAKGPLA
jgi:hypothetical protein